MNGVRIAARLCATIYIFASITLGASAQELAGRIAGATSTSSEMVRAAFLGNGTGAYNVYSASNTTGPFALSWKPIDRFSESVYIDGHLMLRDLDYTVDYAAGTVTLAEALGSSSQVVRVEYTYDPATAAKNGTAVNVSMSLDILKGTNAGVQFIGMYKQTGSSASSTGADLAVLGISGTSKMKRGTATTMLLYNADHADASDADSSFLDRSAVKLTDELTAGSLKLTGTFSRVGEDFDAGSEYSLTRAAQVLDLAAAVTPSKALSLTSSFKSSQSTADTTSGQGTSTLVNSMTFTPSDELKLMLSRTDVDTVSASSETQTVTNSLQVNQTLGKVGTAVATHKDVSTTTNGVESQTSADSITIDAKPSNKLSLKGTMTQTETTASGGSLTSTLSMNAAMSSTTTVTAAINRSDTDSAGKDNDETLGLTSALSKTVSMQMSMTHDDSDATGEQLSHWLKLTARPMATVSLEMAMTGVASGDVGEDAATHSLTLSSTAIRNTTVSLALADSDSELAGYSSTGSVRVEATPIQKVKLTGALSQTDGSSSLETSREARLDLTPSASATIGGGVKVTETNGAVTAQTTDVSVATKPLSFMEISSSLKNRRTVGADDVDTTKFGLSFKPASYLQLTGSYSKNPENSSGVVQATNAQSYALSSTLGCLTMTGAFTISENYSTAVRSQKAEVGLDVKLSSRATLTTSYSETDSRNGTLAETSVYALGYNHRVGNAFSLYLGGKMTRELEDPDPDYEAEARLGLKF